MKNYRFYIKLVLISLSAFACGPSNFKDMIEVTAYKYRTIDSEDLYFDLYAPKNIKNRVLIVFVHGGGFINGKRDDNKSKKIAFNLAKKGYDVISLSYRLTRAGKGFNCNTTATEKLEAFDSASEDVSHAISYILKHSERLNIDKAKIVISGESAGAEAILNLIYNYDSDILPKDFKFAGLISKAGALVSLDQLNQETAMPTLLLHSDTDDKVPYNVGIHHNCDPTEPGYLKLYGSKAIANRLKELNKPYVLHTLKNGSHGMSELSENFFYEKTASFVDTFVLKNKFKQQEKTYKKK